MADEKFPKKTYCYKSDCHGVITGFHLERYFSCKVCKMEITEALYRRTLEKDDDAEYLLQQIDLWEKM